MDIGNLGSPDRSRRELSNDTNFDLKSLWAHTCNPNPNPNPNPHNQIFSPVGYRGPVLEKF